MLVTTLDSDVRFEIDGPVTVRVYRKKRRRHWWYLPFRRQETVWQLGLQAPPEVTFKRVDGGFRGSAEPRS